MILTTTTITTITNQLGQLSLASLQGRCTRLTASFPGRYLEVLKIWLLIVTTVEMQL